MSPDAPAALLEPWIAARLRPLGDPSVQATASDLDLGPGSPRPQASPADAAVLVALVERKAGLTVILTRRADALRRHSGQVAFPGGRLDPGESVVQAALREAWEEIGLPPERVRPVGLGDPFETVTGFRITPVVGFVRPPFTPSPSPDEVAEVFEPPFSWLMDMTNQALHEGVDPDGRVRRYYVMPWEGRRIWGATARIIRLLRERLFD